MKKKSLVVVGISVLAVVLIAYIGGGIYFKDHFLPQTKVGKISIAGDTVEEANRKFAKDLHSQTITITENGETLTSITPLELEASVDISAYLKTVKQEQGNWIWPIKAFQDKNLETSQATFDYNEEALNNLLASLDLDSKERAASQNAKVVTEAGNFVIQDEVQGTQVDIEALKASLLAAFSEGKETVTVEEAYIKPTLTADSEELTTIIDRLEDLASTVITYKIAGQEEVVPAEQIRSWMSIDAEGNPVVDQAAAEAYLDQLHDKYATHDKTRKFNSTNRGTVEIPPGTYGWSIGTIAEAESLVQYVLAGKDVTVEPEINGTGYHADGTDIGNSYVEIDLQAQVMYMYKDGARVFESPIVSGHTTTPTPVGVFYAWNKEENATLVGYNPRRGNDYAQPVNYWVPVDWNGVGIHDANWQTSFASDQWAANGSNGCINTPPGAMTKFFQLVEVGMPVIMF